MTHDKIALRALLEKGSDATFLLEMIGFAAQRPMELETDTLCGAGSWQDSSSSIGSSRMLMVTPSPSSPGLIVTFTQDS